MGECYKFYSAENPPQTAFQEAKKLNQKQVTVPKDGYYKTPDGETKFLKESSVVPVPDTQPGFILEAVDNPNLLRD